MKPSSRMNHSPAFAVAAAILTTVLFLTENTRAADAPPPIQFSRDILPILSNNCFQCHGPDEKARKAKLRLDVHKSAMRVVTPGKDGISTLLQRIHAAPDEGLMPPPRSNHKLTAEQKDLLRRWVEAGAPWGKHWAYETPRQPSLPLVKNTSWCRNRIDHFVLAALEKKGWMPAPEAAKETLIRRVTLDLTGLPPTLSEIDAFLADSSPHAYEKVVDRLLASLRYGERMANDWLDVARFADTNGYQNDFARSMWPWRDWVIEAFNHNMPFDRFIMEQIAGDMMPGATVAQKIASGFNRNNRTVTEAGSIDDEWQVENVVDRVETTAAAFLGLTMGCARCHDHKYDPITQKEFYQFFAFFNSINELGVYSEQRGNVPPLMTIFRPGDKERLQQFEIAISDIEKKVKALEASVPALQEKWLREQSAKLSLPLPVRPMLRIPLDGRLAMVGADGQDVGKGSPMGDQVSWVDGLFGRVLQLKGEENSFFDAGQVVHLDRTSRFSFGGWVKPLGDGAILSKIDDAAAYRGFDLLVSNGKLEVHFVNTWPKIAMKVATRETLPKEMWSHLLVTYDGSSKAAGVRVFVNGTAAELEIKNDNLSATITTKQPLRLGKRFTSAAFRGVLTDIRFYDRVLSIEEVKALVFEACLSVLKIAPERREAAQQVGLDQFFQRVFANEWQKFTKESRAARGRLNQLRQDKQAYEKNLPSAMVMEELSKPRDTYRLERGQYDAPDKSEKLQPNVPVCLPPLQANMPHNRLGLARWLVDPSNPLTARVTVNRFWQHYFGNGLVKTAENFGIQGEWPSHPELLDWLALEFMGTGWNTKALQRLIVTSATYRQASRCTPELRNSDPENRLLARGPRFRLPAESVRDNALAISGLLTEKIGGPSVKPYQPAGLWEELAGGAGEGPYVQDQGVDLYRRSLYVYRKRTVPHPVLSTFDAPSREICQVNSQRTNTPLQALALLNDVTYVEAARRLAERMLTEGGQAASDRLTFAFRCSVARRPHPSEMQVLLRGLDRYLRLYRADHAAAKQLVQHGASPVNKKLDLAELAAYSAVASIILNLDETITKE